eukprot:c6427_g1_i1.p1 GENE.c6427_g1_i1~~c6427_g1_i1.p1  ORF type:complete len:587 (+),score=142.23 c6427_g1_i1:52-1812(+)
MSASPPKEENEEKSMFLKLWPLMRPEIARLGVAMVALVLSSANNMNAPKMIGRIIDVATKREPGKMSSLATKAMIIFSCGALASWARVYFFHTSRDRVSSRLSKKVFETIMLSDTQFIDETESTKLTRVLSDDVNTVAQIVTTDIARGLRSLSSTIGGSVMLLRISPELTVLSLSILPVVGATAMLFSKFVKKQKKHHELLMQRAVFRADERVGQFKTVRLNANERAECERFNLLIDEAQSISRKTAVVEGLFMGGLSLSMSGSLVVVMMYGGTLVHRGSLTSGQLTSFGIYSGLLSLGVAGLSSFVGEWSKSLSAVNRIYKVIHAKPAINLTEGIIPTSIAGEIVFENVGFQYESRKEVEVLRDASFTVKPGQVIGIVGASGSGKSTVVSLLTRLYEVSSGRILFDGQDIRDIQPLWLRQHICVVEQQPALFSGTIYENILYGYPQATEEDVKEAARLANAEKFIYDLPDRFETRVGQRGILLSGGQIQRLAIARALVRKPEILILDEATSNLDPENERAVLQSLTKGLKGCTLIIIAHRPSMVKDADNVIVFEKGEVVQSGKFGALLSKPEGALAKLMKDGDDE